MIIEKIQQILEEVKTLSAKDAKDIEALRVKYLSKKGEISQLMNEFRNVPADMKREVGMKINALKQAATEKINSLRESLATADDTVADTDLTRTAAPVKLGTRHPLTLVENNKHIRKNGLCVGARAGS